MKNISRIIKIFSLPAVGLLMPLSIQAATLDDVVQSIDELRSNMMEWLGAAKEMYIEQLYQENRFLPTTISANTADEAMKKAMKAKIEEVAMPAFRDLLTQAEVDKTSRLLAAIPASDSLQKAQTAPQTFPVAGGEQPKKSNPSEGDVYLYAGTLLTPLVYDMGKEGEVTGTQETAPTQPPKGPSAKAAYAFVQFVTGLGQPTSEINLSKLTERQREQIETAEAGRSYKLYMRSEAAARSLAIDSLLRMYARRIPVPGLGESVGMPNQKDASPAEVDQYLATRRSSNEDWYTEMAQASPAVIQREILSVLVEIQKQIYQSNQYQERAEALLAVIELQNIEANRAVQQEKEEQVKELLGIRKK